MLSLHYFMLFFPLQIYLLSHYPRINQLISLKVNESRYKLCREKLLVLFHILLSSMFRLKFHPELIEIAG